jgi:hypothetical protein
MRFNSFLKATLLAGACIVATTGAAFARDFNVPAGDLKTALDAYAKQTGVALIVSDEAVRGTRSGGAKGPLSPDDALARILKGTGFVVHHDYSGAIAIVPGQSSDATPQEPMVLAQAAPPPRMAVETVTVTSSKLGGADVQTVPIAITALSQ